MLSSLNRNSISFNGKHMYINCIFQSITSNQSDFDCFKHLVTQNNWLIHSLILKIFDLIFISPLLNQYLAESYPISIKTASLKHRRVQINCDKDIATDKANRIELSSNTTMYESITSAFHSHNWGNQQIQQCVL